MSLFGFLRRAEPDAMPVDGVQDEAVGGPTPEEMHAAEIESRKDRIRKAIEEAMGKHKHFLNIHVYHTLENVHLFVDAVVDVANDDRRVLAVQLHSFNQSREVYRYGSISALLTLQSIDR